MELAREGTEGVVQMRQKRFGDGDGETVAVCWTRVLATLDAAAYLADLGCYHRAGQCSS